MFPSIIRNLSVDKRFLILFYRFYKIGSPPQDGLSPTTKARRSAPVEIIVRAKTMDSSVAALPHRRSHLPTRSFRSVLDHLCSSFENNNQISLATPDVLRELVATTGENAFNSSSLIAIRTSFSVILSFNNFDFMI